MIASIARAYFAAGILLFAVGSQTAWAQNPGPPPPPPPGPANLRFALQQAATPQPPVNGVFKTPTLRNAEFTGPYFHQGGQATLEQVIDFYARGGGFPAGGTGPGIRPLNLRPDDRAALAAFLKSLSDDRVRFETGAVRSSRALRSGRLGHRELRSTLPVERRGQNGQASPVWGRTEMPSRCKPSTSYYKESAWMVRGPIRWPMPALSHDSGLTGAVS